MILVVELEQINPVKIQDIPHFHLLYFNNGEIREQVGLDLDMDGRDAKVKVVEEEQGELEIQEIALPMDVGILVMADPD